MKRKNLAERRMGSLGQKQGPKTCRVKGNEPIVGKRVKGGDLRLSR